MGTYIHKMLSFLMAVVVFITTTGFTIIEHHCSCTDTVKTMLFLEKTDCCHHEAPSCCDSDRQSCDLKDRKAGHDCCVSEMNYIRINTPVELPTKAKNYTPDYKLLPVQVINLDHLHLQEDMNEYSEKPFDRFSYFGSDLLIYLHQLKVAPPAV